MPRRQEPQVQPKSTTHKHSINIPYQTFMTTISSGADGPSPNRISDSRKEPGRTC